MAEKEEIYYIQFGNGWTCSLICQKLLAWENTQPFLSDNLKEINVIKKMVEIKEKAKKG